MKVPSIAAALSVVATLASARDCPLESDCVQKSCKNFKVEWTKRDHIVPWKFDTWALTAECKDNAGKKIHTKVYLEKCLGNFDGELIGDFGCNECKLTKTEPLMMECVCKNKRGKSQAKEVNLSEGIWVYDGAIGCYQSGMHKSPGIGAY